MRDSRPPVDMRHRAGSTTLSGASRPRGFGAANRLADSDSGATGALLINGPGSAWQAHLDRRLAANTTEGRAALLQLITDIAPSTAHDRQGPLVAARIAALVAAGLDGRHLLHQAAAAGPLPDDHPASALWWRIVDQLPARHTSTSATSESGVNRLITDEGVVTVGASIPG